MNTKYFKKKMSILCMILMVVFITAAFVGCSDKTVISFTGKTLKEGVVNTSYSDSVGSQEEVTYTLKSGTLPAGLKLEESGAITGTPTAVAFNVKITVTASKNGLDSVDADFIISIVSSTSPNSKSIKFEAEYVDLTDKVGRGPSNSAPGKTMVRKDTAASESYYLGDTYMENLFFDFVITSNAAGKGVLKITLGSALGAIEMNSDVFEISVKGVPIAYSSFQLADSSGKVNKIFNTYVLKEIDLDAGANNVTVKILRNDYCNGGTGGPLIDNIIIDTGLNLTWNPVVANIS